MKGSDSEISGKSNINKAVCVIALLSCAIMMATCLSSLIPCTDAASADVCSADEGEIVIGDFKYAPVSPGSTDLVLKGYVKSPSDPVDLHIQYELSHGDATYHVKAIDDDAFHVEKGRSNVPVVRSLEFDDGIEYIGNSAFESQRVMFLIGLPSTLKSIGAHAFGDCSGILRLVIPDSVTSLGEFAFSGCMGMESLKMGSGLTELPFGCFSGLMSTRELEIGKNVRVIGESCFMDMNHITKLVIPDSVVEIGEGAFGACTEIIHLTIGKNVEIIRNSAFSGLLSVKNLVIPENVRFIGDYAFSGMSMLKHVEFRTDYCIFEGRAFGTDYKFFDESGIEITDPIDLCGKTFDLKNGSMVRVSKGMATELTVGIAIVALISLIVMAGIFRK